MSYGRDDPTFRAHSDGMFFDLDAARNIIPLPSATAWADANVARHAGPIHIGDDTIGNLRVSTIFTGVNTSGRFASSPRVFETMLFRGDEVDTVSRYSSWAEALAAHRWTVGYVNLMAGSGREISFADIIAGFRAIPLCAYQDGIATALVQMGAPPDEALVRVVALGVGYLFPHRLGDAGMVGLTQHSMGHYAIVHGLNLHPGHCDGGWDYPNYRAAKAALDAWDGSGEPAGAIRHWIRDKA